MAAGLGLLGLVFVVGAQGQPSRIVVGLLLWAGAAVVVFLSRQKPRVVETRVVQDIHLSGDVQVQDLRCDKCGASLDQRSVSVRAGAVFVDCGYCKASYQVEEAPKW